MRGSGQAGIGAGLLGAALLLMCQAQTAELTAGPPAEWHDLRPVSGCTERECPHPDICCNECCILA